MKVCLRCNELKPLTAFQKDYRREGKEGFYQNPCKDCRKKTKNDAQKIKANLDNDWYIRSILTRSKIKKEFITNQLIESYRIILKINRTIKNNSRLFMKENIAYCINCKRIYTLDVPIDFIELQKIINSLTEIHQNCETYEP